MTTRSRWTKLSPVIQLLHDERDGLRTTIYEAHVRLDAVEEALQGIEEVQRALLARGKIVGLFPEGEIIPDLSPRSEYRPGWAKTSTPLPQPDPDPRTVPGATSEFLDSDTVRSFCG